MVVASGRSSGSTSVSEPSRFLDQNSGWSWKLFFAGSKASFTATGIAPDLHRTSLLTPLQGTKYSANVGDQTSDSKLDYAQGYQQG
jgi:hypothetical protein